MSQAVTILPSTMRCDTPSCGYAVEADARKVREYVGSKCPRCDAVMVTDETADEIEKLLAVADLVNALTRGQTLDTENAVETSVRIGTAGEIVSAGFKRLVQ